MSYAQDTQVSPEKSQQEIASTLRRYGASSFLFGWEEDRALIQFNAHDRQIRFIVSMPTAEDRRFQVTDTGRSRRDPNAAREAEVRRRWRCLALVIKAKLEAVESGVTEFEEEFLAQIVMPNGATVGQSVLPNVHRAYELGSMPSSLLAIEGRVAA